MGVSQTPQMIAHQFLGTCNSDTRAGKRERLHQSLGRILVCTKLQCQLGTVAANKKCAPNMGVPLMSTIAPGTFQDDVYFVKIFKPRTEIAQYLRPCTAFPLSGEADVCGDQYNL